jgi:hypothetical protein
MEQGLSGVQASSTAKRKHNQTVLDGLALHLAVLDWPQEASQHDAEIRVALARSRAPTVNPLAQPAGVMAWKR